MSSNTMNANVLKREQEGGKKGNQPGEDKQTGRPEKADDEKAEKTLQNKEALS